MIVLNFDGGARPTNPGPAACAWILSDSASLAVLASGARYLGTATNNEAEYRGLIAGLTAALERGLHELEVRSDSQLVVRQMRGEWRVKAATIIPLYAEACALAAELEVLWTWGRRAENAAADAMCTAAIEAAVGKRAAW